MASPSDLAQIWQWNELVPARVDQCVHVIIQERIDAQPDAPAISAWDGALTYAELGRLATNLASRLVGLGIGPDTASIVPLCFEKSMWTAVAMLGVLKAGAGFVLIDPHQPEHRLRSIVKQVGANLIVSSLTQSDLSSRLTPKSIILSSQLFDSSHNQIDSSMLIPDSSSVVYIAFTSGSTGEPKGALISHRNLASALHHQHQRMGFTATTRFYDFSSYSFDASIGIFFTTLVAGGCICVPSENDRRDNLIQSIVSLNANTVDLTPSVAALLSPHLVPSLETVILGGEALQVRDVSRWWDSVRVMSFYGPCECTPTSTINYDAKTPEDAVHLGKGAGLVTWLVDPENHQSLVPLGAVGELLLEGPLVGLGYLHDSERTAASFIADPVWLLAGAVGRPGRHGRLYKTGDLVRYREDGSLIFAGRKDTQIKIRGQRIELGEIEHVLRGHAGVDDAIAVVHRDEDNESEWITAFITVHDNGAAFQASFPLEQWERRLTGESTSIHCGHCETPRRTFTSWESMYDVSERDAKQVTGWLAGMIDPMANNWDASRLPERWTRSEFVLFSLPTAASTNTTDHTPHEGAVNFIKKIIDSTPAVEKTATVFKAAPSDLGPQCLAISSGLVVLNSIIHFFPSQAYLLNVVREALKLEGVKTIVFGHVHSNVLYRESLVEGAIRLFGETISHDNIRSIAEIKLDGSMLLVNPAFFTSLLDRFPGEISHVEIIPNETDAGNRLGPLRYTAVIHVRSEDTQLHIRQVNPVEWVDFEEQGFDRQSLLTLLRMASESAIIPVTNIPYSRSVRGQRFLQLLEGGGEEATNPRGWMSHDRIAEHKSSLSVHDLVDLARHAGRRVEVSWTLQSLQRGALTAVFYHDPPTDDKTRVMFQFPPEVDRTTSLDMFCSQPMQQNMNDKAENELLELLRTRLSSYMVPRVIKVLDRMPLNNNCKIDRRALEKQIQRSMRQGMPISEDKMLSEHEGQVRQIWGDALRIEPRTIGPNDRFFDIGGDSISAMKVVLEARKYGLAITVRDVFFLEVHEMAERISSLSP
ncbi:hypothetical protein J7T55_012151 [Diaporthe amygdali]|uniref:uncharacterized protein n=1 Tax=Phomopsis amygdali TaxID=1214568 RepID=UPI0022FE4967|nr:uncharacterized protein J7T55_012151 [Diaporthe amygdali]KAJ0123682.1 hypothetical protein J7T55_012151 [Diaporthe amygdali]